MKKFLDNNFLLSNPTSEILFHAIARDLPIIDYHNHLNPSVLAENKHFDSLTKLWITDDPYKHRAMRINGISEEGITGKATDKEKYMNWIKTFPGTIGNPLFHWTCMEIKYIFGIEDIPNQQNAEKIWNQCNSILQEDGFGATDILQKWKVEIVCTSDDITDNLSPHKAVSAKGLKLKLFPSLRADSIIEFGSENYFAWFNKLTGQNKSDINTLEDYTESIRKKMDYFNDSGCKLADHSLDAGFSFKLPSDSEAEKLFLTMRKGSKLNATELLELKSYLLIFLGMEYYKRGWTMELHIGAQRYTSTRLRKLVGANGGYAGIGNSCDIDSLCRLLDTLEQKANLPRTILFTLNPADNESFAVLTGSFSQDGMAGKIQFGPAWWYNDNYDGIRKQLTIIASYGLLGRFVGMTTDSRSVLSFSRHEYFRRILCDILGNWVEEGKLPNDMPLLEQLVKDVSYNNSKNMIFS